MLGGSQLAYNNRETPLTKAVTYAGIEAATRNWTGDTLHVMHTMTVKFLQNRAPHPASALARIRCPTLLVHCSDDIVYPLSYAEELLAHLHSASVDARLHKLEGAPHFGNVTHPNETNTLLYDFVLANSSASDLPPTPDPDCVQSPFLAELAAFGLLDVDSESDVDSD